MRKNIQPQLATKSDVKSLETSLRSDVKSLETSLRSDVKSLETSLRLEITSLEIKVDTKLEDMEKRIDNSARRYRDQILTSNDKLSKKLESMMDENTIGFNQLNRQLQNHEERIKKIEQIQQPA